MGETIDKTIVFIRKNSTGEIRKYIDEHEWTGDYIWSLGNYACDCNRHLFFERASGVDPGWDSGECGEDAFSIRIEDESGNELYRDDGWDNP